MSTYALRSKGSINYTHTMPHQGIPKNTAMESATNLHEEILMQKEEEIAVLRQKIEKKRRRQEGQDGEVEVLRERLKEMEQSNVHIRPVTLPTPSSPAASVYQPQQERLNVRLDKFDGKSSAVQWWLKFMAFINLQGLTEHSIPAVFLDRSR